MDRFFQSLREYPFVVGVGVFFLISLVLAVLFGTLMVRSGVSLKPLVFFAGFFAIVAVPQATVHLLDALAHRRAVVQTASSQPPKPEATSGLSPVPWSVVFGPDADPTLITDARKTFGDVLENAEEARLSFSATGTTALAARFASSAAAAEALNRYGHFFQFAQVSGSDAAGWTARRYQGQGEWTHVVAAGRELYAWSGPSVEQVVAPRIRALGPLPAGAGTVYNDDPSKRVVSDRLRQNHKVMAAFLVINLSLAVGWFFKASAWAARIPAAPSVALADEATLVSQLAALPPPGGPMTVRPGPEGNTIEVSWRYADAVWLERMRVSGLRRAHRLVLQLDPDRRTVRVREYWSALDASAGADGLRLDWKAQTGIQFFQFEQRRIIGVQLGKQGVPTGDLSTAYTFNLQELKEPFITAVTQAGWTWQPLVWNAPPALRWLTE